MLVTIVGRHFQVTEPIKEYARGKLTKLDKFASKIKEAHVTLELQKYQHIAEITVYLKYDRIVAKEIAGDMYAAIDNAIDSVKRQLTRHSDKVKGHRKQSVFSIFSNPLSLFREKSAKQDTPKVVKADRFATKPMSVDEAALELKVLGDQFIMFRNAQTNEVNVIYRRKDGTCGLIEPEF